jgi:hypothetical protein
MTKTKTIHGCDYCGHPIINMKKYTPLRKIYAIVGFTVILLAITTGGLWLFWQIATYDYCVIYYGEPCFPVKLIK